MTSTVCEHENPPGARFCIQCGVALSHRCSGCGAELVRDARFCAQCGQAVASGAGHERAESHPSSALNEIRHLTVLFCDLVGSTELAAEADPEDLREMLDAFHAVSGEAVRAHGGHVAQLLGDGMLAYFGYPQVHEDSAERAVRAGLDMQSAVKALSPTQPNTLEARVGIHSGQVVVSEVGRGESRETLALGKTTNVAARVQAEANPGEVFVTDATHQLVADSFVVEERGAYALKGVAEPVALYRVLRPNTAQERRRTTSFTPFVGRRYELDALGDRWRRARKGSGQVMLLLGEPGIGKSRLIEQLREELAEDDAAWLEASSLRQGRHSPFAVIADLIGRGFDWPGDASGTDRLSLIEEGLRAVDLDPEQDAALVAELLDIPTAGRYAPLLIPPEQRRKRLINLVVTWACRSAAQQRPLIVAVEDLQWADPSSLETLERLAEQVATAPILLLLSARTEFRVPWPLRGHHAVLTLTRLDASEVQGMMSDLFARHDLTGRVRETLVARSDGIPLFAEELARTVSERLDEATALTEIPATLQDSLSARLDRLGSARKLVQVAAVLGREFSYVHLHAVAGIEDARLEDELEAILDADLLEARGRPPDAVYQFRHALIQQSAYDSLLRSRRRALHARVAETLSTQFASLAAAQPERLAQHWSAAGQMDRAMETWVQAGDRAVSRSAYAEAITHFEMALAGLAELPESAERAKRELDLQLSLGTALQMSRGFAVPEFAAVMARARELTEEIGDARERVSVLWGLWTLMLSRGDIPAAGEIADELLRAAETNNDAYMLARAHTALSGSRHHGGDHASAILHGHHALALLDGVGEPARSHRSARSLRTQALQFISLGHSLRGEATNARIRCAELQAMADEEGQDSATACLALMGCLTSTQWIVWP